MHKKDSSSIEKHQFKPTYKVIPQGETEGQIALTERHNKMVLAFERFFLGLLSKGLVLLAKRMCL